MKVSNKVKLLVFSARQNKLTFASVDVDGTTIFYDIAEDGAPVWCENEGGNIIPAPNVESVDIEGTMYTIKDGHMYIIDTNSFEDVENAETPTTTYDDAELRTMIAELTARVEALEAKLLEPQTDPIEVEKYSKSKNKKFDLSKFGI